MRRVLVIALAAGFVFAACGGSKGSSVGTVTFADGSSSSVAAGPAAATSTSLAVTSAASTAATTAAPATTTTLPVTTSAPAVDNTLVLPSNVSKPTTPFDRSPRAEDPEIFATYQAAWDGYVWSASHPDDPRWDWLEKTIEPANRSIWRQEIEDHWAAGEVLNAGTGVVTRPRLDDRTPSRVYLVDCQTNGTYWAAKDTGEPVVGQSTEPRLEVNFVTVISVNGKWLVEAANIDTSTARRAECAG